MLDPCPDRWESDRMFVRALVGIQDAGFVPDADVPLAPQVEDVLRCQIGPEPAILHGARAVAQVDWACARLGRAY